MYATQIIFITVMTDKCTRKDYSWVGFDRIMNSVASGYDIPADTLRRTQRICIYHNEMDIFKSEMTGFNLRGRGGGCWVLLPVPCQCTINKKQYLGILFTDVWESRCLLKIYWEKIVIKIWSAFQKVYDAERAASITTFITLENLYGFWPQTA